MQPAAVSAVIRQDRPLETPVNKNPTAYAKPLVVVLLVAALAIVIAQNRGPVQTHFLLITIEMPQILLLALTALSGFVVGVLASALMRRRRTWPRPPGDSSYHDEQRDERTA